MLDSDRQLDLLLRLQLTPGVGPVLARRMLGLFADPSELFGASHAQLRRVEGIGPTKARAIASGLREAGDLARAERERCERAGVRLVHLGQREYPALLREVPDAPLVLYVRGRLSRQSTTHTVGIVGSRRCTAYGMEQAERFASMLAQAGITIVSGGARGIDSASHRAAVRVRGATIVVMGCGIGRCYPPENAGLFGEVVEAGGAVVSELPFETTPAPENFPARNRIISGLSLGVILIEAPVGSGALITARHAVEEHGREVMAVPGRVDSRASEGCHRLIRQSEAALVTSPGDVIELLEPQARHVFEGTHASRYAPVSPAVGVGDGDAREEAGVVLGSLSEGQRRILEALGEGACGFDGLEARTGLAPEAVREAMTGLELRRLVERRGSVFRRRGAGARG